MRKILLIILILAGPGVEAACSAWSLRQAIERSLVKVGAESLGAYQGYCIRMDIWNLSGDSLQIVIEPGRRLRAMNGNYQDILLTGGERVVLKAGEVKQLRVKGFCCQLSGLAPSPGVRYEAGALADTPLVLLARYLSLRDLEDQTSQAAVWALSDRRPTAAITAENDSLAQALREFVAVIKDEVLPWYRIISKTYRYHNGVIQVFNLRLQGTLSYTSGTADYVTLLVTNASGETVCEVKQEWLKPASQGKYRLDLPVAGLPGGIYQVRLLSPGRELARQEFEI